MKNSPFEMDAIELDPEFMKALVSLAKVVEELVSDMRGIRGYSDYSYSFDDMDNIKKLIEKYKSADDA